MYIEKYISEHSEMLKKMARHSELLQEIAEEIVNAYRKGNKVLIFGNGGSAADAQHFTAELEGRFEIERKPLPALTPTNISALTAVSNDYSYDMSFLRFVEGNVKMGDVVIGISTSGRSKNIVNALKKAKEMGAVTISFTGHYARDIGSVSDLNLNIPSERTPIIQEGHCMAYHIICGLVERRLFP